MDYTFNFSDISEDFGPVRVTIESVGQLQNQHTLFVSANDRDFQFRRVSQFPSLAADLVDLGVAVGIADRLCVRQGHQPSHIHIELGVRNPAAFQDSNTIKSLQKHLNWYTRDHWSFTFRLREADPRLSELQQVIPLVAEIPPTIEIALWSGGLDALAGLYTRVEQRTAEQYILVGTGTNTHVHHAQKRLVRGLGPMVAQRTELTRLPIRLSQIAPLVPHRDQRARGFVFLLLGAACALVNGQDTLFIYENGVGAINLPYRDSEIGLDHARSVHPLSLIRMSEFITDLLGRPFTFRNPFIFWTKAKMCKALYNANAHHLACTTVTCDRQDRSVPNRPVRQCGRCSSCVLRRQAFAAVGIKDRTPYVHRVIRRAESYLHFSAMLDQVDTLQELLWGDSPWRNMTRKYPKLTSIADRMAKQEALELLEVEQQLINMYRCYVNEWDAVRSMLEEEFAKEKRPVSS